MKSKYLIVLVLALFGAGILFVAMSDSNAGMPEDKEKVVLYKSPDCGCCVKYIAYLRKNNYEVEVIEEENMLKIKQRYGVVPELESCHTAIFGDYVVEGHVPIEVIKKLQEQKPNTKGIALPDMPAGSPGMPGVKQEPFEVFYLDSPDEVFLNY